MNCWQWSRTAASVTAQGSRSHGHGSAGRIRLPA